VTSSRSSHATASSVCGCAEGMRDTSPSGIRRRHHVSHAQDQRSTYRGRAAAASRAASGAGEIMSRPHAPSSLVAGQGGEQVLAGAGPAGCPSVEGGPRPCTALAGAKLRDVGRTGTAGLPPRKKKPFFFPLSSAAPGLVVQLRIAFRPVDHLNRLLRRSAAHSWGIC